MSATDRELLEMAAKAAGFHFSWVGIDRDIPEILEKGTWNPLAFDGDALRLAVELRLHICNPGMESWAQRYLGEGNGWLTIKEPHDGNASTSTRRAIVRAAAAIAAQQTQGGGKQ